MISLEEWDRVKTEALWPGGERLKVAFFLAPDWQTCRDLLLGRYVDPLRLDPDWLRWAKREHFVALRPALECL